MGVYSYALKGLKAGATKLAQKLSGQGKTTGTGAIKSVKSGTQLTKKRKQAIAIALREAGIRRKNGKTR